jgi:hypothetical protein
MITRFDGKTVVVERSWNWFSPFASQFLCFGVREGPHP